MLSAGSGTGLVSIALGSLLRTRAPSTQARITATDLGVSPTSFARSPLTAESAIELMNENLALNDFASEDAETAAPGSVHLSARVLDWDEPIPAWVDGPWPDLIV